MIKKWFVNQIEDLLKKKYGKWLIDRRHVIRGFFGKYSKYDIIYIYIGDNQYDLAKIVAIKKFLSKDYLNQYIYTDFLKIKLLSNQLVLTEFKEKLDTKKMKLLVTLGSNIGKSDKYLQTLNLNSNNYELVALDYEIINF